MFSVQLPFGVVTENSLHAAGHHRAVGHSVRPRRVHHHVGQTRPEGHQRRAVRRRVPAVRRRDRGSLQHVQRLHNHARRVQGNNI